MFDTNQKPVCVEYVKEEKLRDLFTDKITIKTPILDVVHYFRKIQDELEKLPDHMEIRAYLWIPAIGPKFIQPILKLKSLDYGGIDGDIVINIKEDGMEITSIHLSSIFKQYHADTGDYLPMEDLIRKMLNKILDILYKHICIEY